jgi:uncharacterized protein (DUF169 family)
MDMAKTKENAESIRQILGLKTYPVGVKFYFDGESIPPNIRKLNQYRYCQALMEARNGDHVLLDAEGMSCPAAAASFGFKPLPEGLKSGKILIGFGIVQNEEAGKRIFEGMVGLEPNTLRVLYLFPLEEAVTAPDIIVVEDEVEKLMWFALAKLNIQGGKRVESSTAVLQATCVDATLIPYVKKQFNMSFGCYGCRDATDIGLNEAVMGFPFDEFEGIAAALEFLSKKAIPNSRSKKAFAVLKRKNSDHAGETDCSTQAK